MFFLFLITSQAIILNDPLEQFDILKVIPFGTYTLTNLALLLGFNLVLLTA
jgi:hypothetical protein